MTTYNCGHGIKRIFCSESMLGRVLWRKLYCRNCGVLVTAAVINAPGPITTDQRGNNG